MKTKYYILAFLFFASLISAQNIQIPKDVKELFLKKYPKASEVNWSKENSEEFEAEFLLDGVKMSVVIDEDGEIEEIENAIATGDLPEIILNYIKENYSDFEITEAAQITDDDQNVFYEAEVSNGDTKKDLLFDKDGQPINLQKESEDENNEVEEE